MDVEKRMNLSLDDIIKSKAKGSSGASGAVGKGKPRGRGAKKAGVVVKAKKQLGSKTGGVRKAQQATKKRKIVNVQSGKVRVQLQGKKAAPVNNKSQKRRVLPGGQGKPQKRSKRVVQVPPARSITVTITNEKAFQAQRQHQVMPQASQYQQGLRWASQAQPQAAPQWAPQPAYGFGPRNMLPREDAASVTASRFSLSRMRDPAAVHRAPGPIQRRQIPTLVDYDNSRTAMRMDYGR